MTRFIERRVEPIKVAPLHRVDREIAGKLYFYLSQLSTGDALDYIARLEGGNVFEVWTCEKKVGRSLSERVSQFVQPGFVGDLLTKACDLGIGRQDLQRPIGRTA